MRYLGFIFVAAMIWLTSCTGDGGSGQTGAPGDTARVTLAELTRQIDADKGNPDLYQNRARYYFAHRDFDLALKDIRQAISFNSKVSGYYVTLSDIYLLMGQPDQSKENLLKAIDVNEKDVDARLKLAKLYLIIKDYQNCFEVVKALLKLDPSNAGAYHTRAIALLEKGDTVAAVADLKKTVDYDQQNYEAYVQLGELYGMRKDPVAELYFKNALNIRPQSREAMYMLGMYYQETAQYAKAIGTYENLGRSDTSFREAPYNIGYIHLVYLKDFRKAVDFFTESIRRDPEYYKAWYNRGYAYELMGDYTNARRDYQTTLKLEVNYDKAIEAMNRLDRTGR